MCIGTSDAPGYPPRVSRSKELSAAVSRWDARDVRAPGGAYGRAPLTPRPVAGEPERLLEPSPAQIFLDLRLTPIGDDNGVPRQQ